jgi:hypothetical protein
MNTIVHDLKIIAKMLTALRHSIESKLTPTPDPRPLNTEH